jgi:hypothetical protein
MAPFLFDRDSLREELFHLPARQFFNVQQIFHAAETNIMAYSKELIQPIS